ncbi:hypothetical protein SADUNF_Sadunf18G0038100 [Salix dunnii]|uniref:Uncharacterized protein n=1 Tax=Salix dunnii TaxID=1413687 RepID=A0A835J5U5_9ROSI|nr:hypothetical protein SADUNF_Sadunf18G0038100 [Salix dunnii]
MPLAPRSRCDKREANKGAWTAKEDQKLAQAIEIHGPKRWRSIAAKADEEKPVRTSTLKEPEPKKTNVLDMDKIAKGREEGTSRRLEDSKSSFVGDDFFDFSNEDPMDLDWMSKFLTLDESLFDFP